MKKWFRRMGIGILVIIALIVVAVNVGMRVMHFSDSDAKSYFEEKDFDGIIENILIHNRSIKIIADKPQESDSILIVFVHGAPGSWDAFKRFVTDKDLNQNARVVSYDRPGYGGSGKIAMPGIQEQTDILIEIVKRYGLKKNILIGHSYGGPLVGMAAAAEGIKVDATIMIAPLNDPKSEPIFWYSYFSFWKWSSWLLPSDLVVAGSEKFAHSSELEKIQDHWAKISSKIIHIHGFKDGLAPCAENIEFSKRNIPQEHLEIISYKDKGHLLIWTDYNLMRDVIQKTIENMG